MSYYAVFDGHNGARASRFAAENLHHNIALKFPKGMFGQDPLAGWTRQSGSQSSGVLVKFVVFIVSSQKNFISAHFVIVRD